MFSVPVSVHAVALINCSVNNSTVCGEMMAPSGQEKLLHCETSEQKLLNLIRAHLLHRTFDNPPVVALDLLQLVELGGDVVDGELQQVPESSQVLRGGPRHGTWVLHQLEAFKHLLFIIDVMDMLRLQSV